MSVKEVYLRSRGYNIRMEPQHLQQSPGAALFHTDDNSPWKTTLQTSFVQVPPIKRHKFLSSQTTTTKRRRRREHTSKQISHCEAKIALLQETSVVHMLMCYYAWQWMNSYRSLVAFIILVDIMRSIIIVINRHFTFKDNDNGCRKCCFGVRHFEETGIVGKKSGIL